MPLTEIAFLILVVVVAFLYASVGHGGASGYLAIMALFSFAPQTMRPTALILNLFVSLIAFFQFYRNGFFQRKLFIPLIIGSIPAAFFGGMMSLDNNIYKKLLSIVLLIPAIRLAGFTFENKQSEMKPGNATLFFIGAIIGLISGMIGIGGGIILSPLLLFMKWTDIKQTAAISSLFIFFNSISGLFGLSVTGFEYEKQMIILVIAALIGALAGSYLGASKFKSSTLNRLLAVALLIASVKLMFT